LNLKPFILVLYNVHFVGKDFPKDAVILTINYDTGERYLSVDGLYQENILEI